MHRVVLVDPGRARAAAPELDRDPYVGPEVDLVAAERLRLEQAEEPRLLQLLDRFLGDTPGLLAFGRPRGEAGRQGAGAGDELLVADCVCAFEPWTAS